MSVYACVAGDRWFISTVLGNSHSFHYCHQVTAGLGFFSVFSSFSYAISSENSDSPAVYGDLFPSSGVPSGIVM